MEKIILDQVTVEHRKGALTVTHKGTGASVPVQPQQLQRWCLQQLRSALTMKKEPV